MASAFRVLKGLLVQGAPAAFVVGTNRTTLGGQDFAIETPTLLAHVGEQAGFRVDALLPMDTYPRYDMHQKNSINEESLLVLRA
jgi:site-specific DNA-methyltransferase (cytosine-N4-specific)